MCQVYEDSDAALQMAGFYAQVGNPLLSDVKIKYVNASVEPGCSACACEVQLHPCGAL